MMSPFPRHLSSHSGSIRGDLFGYVHMCTAATPWLFIYRCISRRLGSSPHLRKGKPRRNDVSHPGSSKSRFKPSSGGPGSPPLWPLQDALRGYPGVVSTYSVCSLSNGEEHGSRPFGTGCKTSVAEKVNGLPHP